MTVKCSSRPRRRLSPPRGVATPDTRCSMDDVTRETWKPIPGYTGYEASDRGRIRSHRLWRGSTGPRILKSLDDGRGYPAVFPTPDDGKRRIRPIHQLMMLAFAGPRPEGMEARHLNDIKTDNRWPENLAWGTHRENLQDMVRNGHSNVAKTHCPQGHAYEGRNLIIAKRGNGRTFRQCRICLTRAQPWWKKAHGQVAS